MSGARNSEVLCVGRLYCDLIFSGVPRFPTPGTEVYASGMELHLGGGAVITAQHLDILGCAVALSAFLPAQPFQGYCNEELQQANMEISLCSPAEKGLDPQITVAITGPQDRAFLTRRSGRPFPDLRVEDLANRKIRHLHIGELASLAECPQLLDLAKKAGVSVSLDCSWDETLDASVAPLISAVDVFLPNEEEVARLRALGVSEPFAPMTVTKCGAKGATALKGSDFHFAPAAAVPVIDTTGAGDAFNAGFLAAWLDGADLDHCLVSGNRQGEAAVQTIGGSPRAAPDLGHQNG